MVGMKLWYDTQVVVKERLSGERCSGQAGEGNDYKEEGNEINSRTTD